MKENLCDCYIFKISHVLRTSCHESHYLRIFQLIEIKKKDYGNVGLNASEGGEGKGTFVEILCRFIDIRDAYVVENVKSGSLIPTVIKAI